MSVETQRTSGEKDECGEQIDMSTWLTENRLTHIRDVFTSKNVMIEELLEFSKEELMEYAVELGLDVLSRKRFIKGVEKLRNQRRPAVSPSQAELQSALAMGQVVPRLANKRPLVVSREEQECISKLYSSYETVSQLMASIQSCLQLDVTKNISNNNDNNNHNNLNQSIYGTKQDINNHFKNLIENTLLSQKKRLLNEIDVMKQRKKEIIAMQISQCKDYCQKLEKSKLKVESMLIDKEYNNAPTKRKKEILNICNQLFSQCSLIPITNANIQFTCSNEMIENFVNCFYVSGCDTPVIDNLEANKVSHSSVQVESK